MLFPIFGPSGLPVVVSQA